MNWKSWLKPERLVPGLTILFALFAEALDLFNIVTLTIGEQIILILVMLLAIDALTERMSILENIRNDIKSINLLQPSSKDFLTHRKDVPKLEERLKNAKSLDLCGHSLLAISTQFADVIQDKLSNGCKVRALVLNSQNKNLMEACYCFSGESSANLLIQNIQVSLGSFLAYRPNDLSNSIQVRVYNSPFTHGILIVNAQYEDGEMRVEPYITGRRPSSNPGFLIKKHDDSVWFDAFFTEFNEQWGNSIPLEDLNLAHRHHSL